MKKTINLVLSSGLLVVSAKLRSHNPVATLFITDYSENTRILFDMEHKRILANRDDIALNEKDVENLMTALGVKDIKG